MKCSTTPRRARTCHGATPRPGAWTSLSSMQGQDLGVLPVPLDSMAWRALVHRADEQGPGRRVRGREPGEHRGGASDRSSDSSTRGRSSERGHRRERHKWGEKPRLSTRFHGPGRDGISKEKVLVYLWYWCRLSGLCGQEFDLLLLS